MERKSVIAVVTITAVCIILIIAIPATIFLVGFSNYGKIDDTLTFYYLPSKSTPVEELSLNAELGNIEVQYTTTPTNYHAKVEVNVEISGSNVEGKSCWEFFDIDWQNKSSPIAFSMERKSDNVSDISSWSIENLNIIVTLRADIVYDINLTVLEGNAEISVPFAVFVNNVAVRSTAGNIDLDFNQCVIGGRLIGITTIGNISLNAYDVEFFRDSAWILTTETGDINIKIYQYEDMGADVTVKAIVTNGSIFLTYKDSNPNVGAKIETDGRALSGSAISGETYEGFTDGFLLVPPRPNEQVSNDFPTINNYEILLIKTSDYFGDIYFLDLSSF